MRSSQAGLDVPTNDQSTGRRTVRPVSRTDGQGEQIPQLLHTSPATENVIQTHPQQRPAQGPSEAVGSNFHINQRCQPESIDGRTTENRNSRTDTLGPPIPPKVPLAASICILCDSQQAIVEAGAGVGAFCDECWTAAHRAARSVPPAPKVGNGTSSGDNEDSNATLDQNTTANTRRNKHVHFQAPQPSRATRDEKVKENVKNPPDRVGPNEHLRSGKPTQASEKQAQTLQGPKANVQTQTTSTTEGHRKAQSRQSRVTTDKAKKDLSSTKHQLQVARNEPSLDLRVNNSKIDSSVNDRIIAIMDEEELRESGGQKGNPTKDRRSAAKKGYLEDKSKDATKGNLSAKGAKSVVDEAKGVFARDNALSKSTSSVGRSEKLFMKDPLVIDTAKTSGPTPHAANGLGNNNALDALHDSNFLRVRRCEAGSFALCEFCSNLPATLTTSVGFFCDHCWDTAMQAEADRGVLTKPADLGDVPSVRDPAAQERVRTNRRARPAIDETRSEQSHNTLVEAAVEQGTCRCEGQPATVEVSDVGTLCQNCLGHVTKAGKAAEDRNKFLFSAEGSATQKRNQSGPRLSSATDVQVPESQPHVTLTEVAAQHQPCKCAGRQATFLVDDVGILCWNCLGLVLETDKIPGNLSTSVSDLSKASKGTKKPSPASHVESETINKPRGSEVQSSCESTKENEPVAQIRGHRQELLDNESPRRKSNGLPVLYLCKSCGKHPATELQEIRWVCLGCLGEETGDPTGHSSKPTAHFD